MKILRFGFIGLFLLCFGIFIYKYKQINNEFLTLQDEHCIKVNPLIIQRKYSYQSEMSLIAASASAEQVQITLNDYLNSNRNYLKEEKVWLDKWSNYINRLDVKWFLRGYRYQLAVKIYQTFKAEYDIADTINLVTKYPNDSQKQAELTKKIESIKEQENKDMEEFQKLLNTRNTYPDLRDVVSYFMKYPPSKCPLENYNIPNINPNDFFLPKPNIVPNS